MSREVIVIVVFAIVIGLVLWRKMSKKGGETIDDDESLVEESVETEPAEKKKWWAKLPALRGRVAILGKNSSPSKSPESTKSLESPKGEEVKAPANVKPPVKPPTILACVFNNMTGHYGLMKLAGEEVGKMIKNFGTIGSQVFDEEFGKYVYWIHHGPEGYYPTPIPRSTENTSMQLHRDLQHPETEEWMDMEEDKTPLAKYGIYLLFAGIVIFLMWTSIAGK